jgi:tRNA1Val (adenine37-N6)-methyltransferase
MKVGTDGVLLGAWADLQSAGRILDAGTGSGLVAIMMAQRSEGMIDAVEVDEQAFMQAKENIAACPWKDRINAFHDSFQHFAATTLLRYDLVISNPPFFRNSLRPGAISRSLARHDDKLSYESLLFYTAQILGAEGRLIIIVPASETEHLTELAYFQDLHPIRKTLIRPHPGKDLSRCLMAFSKDPRLSCSTSELIIKQENNGKYTEEFRALAGKYYLKI